MSINSLAHLSLAVPLYSIQLSLGLAACSKPLQLQQGQLSLVS